MSSSNTNAHRVHGWGRASRPEGTQASLLFYFSNREHVFCSVESSRRKVSFFTRVSQEKKENESVKKAYLVSGQMVGENDREGTWQISRQVGLLFDIIHVGNRPERGRKFCKEISNQFVRQWPKRKSHLRKVQPQWGLRISPRGTPKKSTRD